ncbi:MAG: ATP-binding protein [Myxococcota bacterium]
MHPYVVVPLLVCLGAAVLASAVVAREATSRASWVIATALAAAGVWCFLDVLINTSGDSRDALFWSRSLGFAYLFLAPLSLDLVAELQPGARAPLSGWIRAGYWASAGLALLHFGTPWFLADVAPTDWGWVYRPGPLFPFSYLYTAAFPVYAVVMLLRRADGSVRPSVTGPTVLGAVVLVPVVMATVTDALLPLLSVPSPRVGAMAVALFIGSTWAVNARSDRQAVPASSFARQLLDLLPDGIALLQGNDRIRSVNASLARMLDRPDEDLLGRPIDDLLAEPLRDPSGRVEDHETWLQRPDGALLPVSLSTTLLRDRQGYAIGRLLAIRDHREVVVLRRRLVTSGRLAAVGELSAGIAHEVNNPVAYIHANLNLLERHTAELAKRGDRLAHAAKSVQEVIGRSLEGVGVVADIVREVRNLSHADADERRAVDLGDLIRGILRLAAHRLNHGQIDLELPDLPPVECSEQQVKQVFLDLFLNAARVTPPGGRIRVRGERLEREVRVSVEDQGPRMAAEDLVGLFDPLTSGRATREGRGLGLSISYQILRQHGGHIEVESPPDAGTRVTLRWPLDAGDEGVQ